MFKNDIGETVRSSDISALRILAQGHVAVVEVCGKEDHGWSCSLDTHNHGPYHVAEADIVICHIWRA